MPVALEDIHQRRLAANKVLITTFRESKKLERVHLTSDDLDRLKVQLLSFNLRGKGTCGAVRSGIQFYESMPEKEMESLPNSTAEFDPPDTDDPTYSLTTPESQANFYHYLSMPAEPQFEGDERRLINYGPWGESNILAGVHPAGSHDYAFGRPGRYEWKFQNLWSTFDTEHPHLIMHSLHAMSPTEDTKNTVTRGELALLIAFMVANMAFKKFEKHEFYPILMFSFFSTKVRVLQAYFDGEKLQIHKSVFVDIGTETSFRNNKNDLVRWMLGKPIGLTEVSQTRI